MLDPKKLLDSVNVLLNSGTEEDFRRAISTAYYALFHKTIIDACNILVGPENTTTSGYSILYRSFEHGSIKKMALNISNGTQSYLQKYKYLSFDTNLVDWGSSFVTLQSAREEADYNPIKTHTASDVLSIIGSAELGFDALDNVPLSQKRDIYIGILTSKR